MFSAIVARMRNWRLRRLRVRASYLEEKLELYRKFPHNLGFEGLERVATEQRKLRRLHFAIGLIELQQRRATRATMTVVTETGAERLIG